MAAAPDVSIQIEGLINRFGNQVVHDELDLIVYRGEGLGLVGGSGSGKSVLIHSIIGLHRPDAGRIWFHGQDLLSLSNRQLLKVQKCWGMLFQGGALFSGLTVIENIEQPMRENLELSPQLMRELSELKLRLVGLPVKAGDKFPAQLSGGMIKRAALARAISLEPEILILDEPTAGLDPIAAQGFDNLIQDLRQSLDITVIIVTHDLHTITTTCDRLAVLIEGKAVTGTLADLRQLEQPWIREYFHGPRMNRILTEG